MPHRQGAIPWATNAIRKEQTMNIALQLIMALHVLGVALTHAVAAQEAQPDGTVLLRVGHPGIHCYKEPCPWRGIALVDGESGSASMRPLWSGSAPPKMDAASDDEQFVVEAWREFGCVLVEGGFDGTTLTVDRIVGDC
jgi:hypothetical protein